jgi:hypothetical protein
VPKSDPQAQRLLSAREDIFERYEEGEFVAAFSRLGLRDVLREPVRDSGRTLHLFAP